MNGVEYDDEVVPPGVPENCRACWLMLMRLDKHMARVEGDVEKQKEAAGRIKLSASGMMLVWGILVVFATCMLWIDTTVATINVEVRQLKGDVGELSAIVLRHVESPGHSVTIQRLNELEKEIDSQRFDRIEGKKK